MEKDLANKAAKWWSDQLRGNAKLDNGDNSPTGGMTFALASLLQETENSKGNKDDADKFEAALSKILEARNDKWFIIRVDYSPDYILEEAAKKANINLGMTRLPWKTVMWINEGKISAACGYGAEKIEIE